MQDVQLIGQGVQMFDLLYEPVRQVVWQLLSGLSTLPATQYVQVAAFVQAKQGGSHVSQMFACW